MQMSSDMGFGPCQAQRLRDQGHLAGRQGQKNNQMHGGGPSAAFANAKFANPAQGDMTQLFLLVNFKL
jgi:hypothetical protein